MKNKLKILEPNITNRYFFIEERSSLALTKIYIRFYSSGLPTKKSPLIVYDDSLSNKAKALKDNKGKSGIYR